MSKSTEEGSTFPEVIDEALDQVAMC